MRDASDHGDGAPHAAQQPTPAATDAAVPTTTATNGTVATSEATTAATSGTTATGEATAGAATPAASGSGQNATPAIVAATNAFLATLSDTEKDTVLFDWTDTAQKQRWSNFPEGAFQHAGLMMGTMSEAQQTACLAVLQAILSEEGYNRVIAE